MKDWNNFVEHYQNIKNRNKRFKELINIGITNIRKSSSRNQLIHPQYIEDYKGVVETGFDNTQYKTSFSVLYNIERALI